MPVRPLRQIFSVLLVAAYLSATMLTAAPSVIAARQEMSGGIVTIDKASEVMPMPCNKGMKSGCVTDVGCIFMVSLPANYSNVATLISWSPVTYTLTAEFPPEVSIKPALGPPISRA
jgi:hypothetical protein